MYNTIICEKDGPVAVVTLNRPERMNSLSVQLMQELADALAELERDDEVGALVITGARKSDGRPCFCAGADLKDMAANGSVTFYARFSTAQEAYLRAFEAFAKGTDTIIERGPISVFDRLANFSKPTIAAVDGICTAGGLEMALVCDMRIVAETAQMCDLHMKNIGHLGGAGVETRLTQLVGPSKAKELLWTGDIIDGQEAWRIGLANRVFPSNQMLEKAIELGKDISSRRRDAVRLSKATIDARMIFGERDSLRYTDLAAALLNLMSTPEVTNEGYNAFAEKRKPSFENEHENEKPLEAISDRS